MEERLHQELSDRLRELLNFALAMQRLPPDKFEKPGVRKVALIVRDESAAV